LIRVSDFIANHLNGLGVRAVFLLSGGGMMHLIDAISRAGVPYVCCHHEQACAMAAEGYARQKGALGVCYATSGPGATNIVTGLVGAWQDSSPVLFITGQSKRSQTIQLNGSTGLRQFGTFEVDIVPIVSSVTKYAHMVETADSIRYHLEKAVHLATTGRPGPVLLDIPLDIQGAPIDPEGLIGFIPPASAVPKWNEKTLDLVLKKISSATRPLLLIGHGVRSANAVAPLGELLTKLQIPVVTTQLAKDAVAYDHPLFVGHCGPKGDRPGNFAVQAADLILSIGSSLHSQTIGFEAELFAPAAYKIQVDSDSAVLNRGDVAVDERIEADVREFITAVVERAGIGSNHDAWRARCAGWKAKFMVRSEPHVISPNEINFYEFADALSDALDENSTVVTDAGSAFYVMGQGFRLKTGQRYIVSGALGAMGFALPAAIGAAAAAPERTVVCVTGDGSLHLNVHELATLTHNGFNVKLFIIDNDGYASIRNTQKGFFAGQFIGASRDSGVSLPSLDKLAAAYGIRLEDMHKGEDLTATICRVMALKGPVLCRVHAQVNQLVIPGVASRQLPDGRMRSNPLHVMSPLLPENVLAAALGDLIAPDPAEPTTVP
jgi:acetolactate synthase-1/2/3 large subunit